MPLNCAWSPPLAAPRRSPGCARMPAAPSGRAARSRDGFRLPEVGAVAGDLVQHDEPADDHALIVGPGRAAVVRAVAGRAVVDQAGQAVDPLALNHCHSRSAQSR